MWLYFFVYFSINSNTSVSMPIAWALTDLGQKLQIVRIRIIYTDKLAYDGIFVSAFAAHLTPDKRNFKIPYYSPFKR